MPQITDIRTALLDNLYIKIKDEVDKVIEYSTELNLCYDGSTDLKSQSITNLSITVPGSGSYTLGTYCSKAIDKTVKEGARWLKNELIKLVDS